MDEEHALLNIKELRARGWTPAMIRNLLGREDTVRPNPFYRRAASQRLYARARVLAAEQTPDFGHARRKSLQRAAQGRAIAARKAAALLQELAPLTVQVRRLGLRELGRGPSTTIFNDNTGGATSMPCIRTGMRSSA